MSKLSIRQAQANRETSAFRSPKDMKRYWIMFSLFLVMGVVMAIALVLYNNPVPLGSSSFFPIIRRRVVSIIAMALAATCQSLATVAFQSITHNRVITPSLLGFEALYSTIQTGTMFFFGVTAFQQFSNLSSFMLQVFLMIAMSFLLYAWLLRGKSGDLQLLLIIGVMIGTGLRSLSTFMRRLLAPSEFDVLQARLFGSVNHADPSYFPIAIPLVLIAALALFFLAKKLNLLSLGQDIATSLGVGYKSLLTLILILVSVLMSVSTALVGPLTFFGFLIATLSYEASGTYDHRYIFPMTLVIGFFTLSGSYFIMNHIFNAQGVVSVIIELIGGLAFLFVILRKGVA